MLLHSLWQIICNTRVVWFVWTFQYVNVVLVIHNCSGFQKGSTALRQAQDRLAHPDLLRWVMKLIFFWLCKRGSTALTLTSCCHPEHRWRALYTMSCFRFQKGLDGAHLDIVLTRTLVLVVDINPYLPIAFKTRSSWIKSFCVNKLWGSIFSNFMNSIKGLVLLKIALMPILEGIISNIAIIG